MSEYQFYDFAAVDRPLTSKQMTELRAKSTRAEITPTRFTNEYMWGDFRSDTAKLVERYFDAHLYFANWGSRRLILRVPAKRVSKSLRAYFIGDTGSAKVTGEHMLIDLNCDFDGAGEPDEASLNRLVPLRAELMDGDLRVAYLAWLVAVELEDLDDDVEEPPVPPGLSTLTEAQEAFVDLFLVSPDLLGAAAAASASPSPVVGKKKRVQASRTVGELRAAAEELREQREQAEQRAKDVAKKKAEAARNRRLDALAKRVDAAWQELEATIENRGYADALKIALELQELAARDGETDAFTKRFKEMRKRQVKRPTFFQHWSGANIRREAGDDPWLRR